MERKNYIYQTIDKSISCHEKKKEKRARFTLLEISDLIEIAYDAKRISKEEALNFIDRLICIVATRRKKR